MMSWLLRFGPLVAAALVGLQAIPGFSEVASSLLEIFKLFGIQAPVDLAKSATEFVLQIVLLIGVARKIWSLVQKYFR